MALISDDCEIRNLSPASRIMLGNAPHELASTSIDDLVSPEDLDPMRSTQSLVMSSVVATGLGVCAARMAARCGRKDGREVWVETPYRSRRHRGSVSLRLTQGSATTPMNSRLTAVNDVLDFSKMEPGELLDSLRVKSSDTR
jgi:hypothetical protein